MALGCERMSIINLFNQGMAEGFYKLFWQECGTKGLTTQQKVEALTKLKNLSLKIPYWDFKENETIQGKTLSELFPELIPANLCKKHTHLTKLSGLLLYVMHMEIFNEIKTLAENGKLTKKQIGVMQQ
jgi:hypothetical protein